MGFIEEALFRAKNEGKINPALLPWEVENSDVHVSKGRHADNGKKPSAEATSLMESFQEPAHDDIKKIIEKIKVISKEKKLRVIGITSAIPKEGTTTLAAYMSYMLAGKQTGVPKKPPNTKSIAKNSNGKDNGYANKVLLIDTQWQHTFLHRIFKITNSPGLREYTSHKASLRAIVKNVANTNLKVITPGEIKEKGCDQLKDQDVSACIAKLKNQFKFILVDIPSLLHNADGIPLCKLCDGVILIIRADYTRWEIVKEAERLLKESDIQIIGSILNRRKFFIPQWLYKKL